MNKIKFRKNWKKREEPTINKLIIKKLYHRDAVFIVSFFMPSFVGISKKKVNKCI